ncbi:hypothetical protein V8C42DRAFT_324116 [Trichoderma barbatum]
MVSDSAMRTSLHTILLLSLSSTTPAATNISPRKPPARILAQLSPLSHFQDASVVVAAQCRPGEVVCNSGCMPAIGECCPDGLGYCKQGFSCITDGCCPIGHECSDKITCDLGEVPCGDKMCMPKDAVCCPNGSYCGAGEECVQNGFKQFCQRVGGSGDPHNGDESKTTGGAKTGSIAESTSSRGQSTTLSRTTLEEAPGSTPTDIQTQAQEESSTSTSALPDDTSSVSTPFIITGHPIVTPFLPPPASSSATTTEFTSSTTGPSTATTTSGGNPAVVKMSGVTLALVFVSIIMMTL